MVDRRRKLHQEIVADLPRQDLRMLNVEIRSAQAYAAFWLEVRVRIERTVAWE